jgi:hypothetical protein
LAPSLNAVVLTQRRHPRPCAEDLLQFVVSNASPLMCSQRPQTKFCAARQILGTGPRMTTVRNLPPFMTAEHWRWTLPLHHPRPKPLRKQR